MSTCIKTPFSFEEVMGTLYSNASDAFADMCANEEDLVVRMHSMTSVLTLFSASLCCEYAAKCPNLVNPTLALWRSYMQWCTMRSIPFDIDTYMPSLEPDKHILLDFGESDCLEFDNICKTYHLSPRKPFMMNPQSTQRQKESVALPWMHDSLRMNLVSGLATMYIEYVRKQIHIAMKQDVLCCKIPFEFVNWVQFANIFAADDNWEDAALYGMLSSDKTTISMLLKLWPYESRTPETHQRKLLHFKSLLQLSLPIVDLDGVLMVLVQKDYLSVFYKTWVLGGRHMQEFLTFSKIRSCQQLEALRAVMQLANHVFVRFAVPRLWQKSPEFKTMLNILARLPNNGLQRVDFEAMLCLDPHTVTTLLTLS